MHSDIYDREGEDLPDAQVAPTAPSTIHRKHHLVCARNSSDVLKSRDQRVPHRRQHRRYNELPELIVAISRTAV